MVFTRQPGGPVLTRDHVPDVPPDLIDATSIFNPGACRREDGRPMLLARVQTRGRRTLLMRVFGCQRGDCRVDRHLVEIVGLEAIGAPVHHVYDPRITRLGDRWIVTCALDLDDGGRVGLFATDDFSRLELIGLTGERDTRNGVLFPGRIGGRYLLLERPNTVAGGGGVASGDTIELLSSDDLATWRSEGPVMQGRWRGWDELIGPGPPPLPTAEGWLLIYHGVATHLGGGIYQAGVALLDRDDPGRLLARTRDNVLEPREPWEMIGQVPNVVFPTGLVTGPPRDDGTLPVGDEVTLVYGAADTCVGAATSTVGALLEACRRS
ncbi:hypothetical protein GF314_07400 [bacterium]|nr:hypothetical protein [bacterium]